jgi:hypothetical protein
MQNTKHEVYTVWSGMKARCSNPKTTHYDRYGGRGIKVCERWQKSFSDFIADMGPRPLGYVIDRIDNDGNYEPNNCRWVTRGESQRNQHNTLFVEIAGVRYKAADLADISGLKTDTVVWRAKKGWDYDKVMSPEPIQNLEGLKLGGKVSGAVKAARTRCFQGHPFTPENTRYAKTGTRLCYSCYCHRKGLKCAPYPMPG